MGYHEDLTGNTAASRVDRHALLLPIKWWTEVERREDQYVVSIICRINDVQNQSPAREEFSFAFGREQLAKALGKEQNIAFRFINELSLVKQQAEKHKNNINSMLRGIEYSDPGITKANLENYNTAIERMKKVDCYTELHSLARNLAFMSMVNGCHSRDELYKLCSSSA